jgi:hypothetical protein
MQQLRIATTARATCIVTGFTVKTKSTDKKSSPNPQANPEVILLRKYKAWANLNAEGKKTWGDIFQDGIIPIQSIIPLQATLEGVDKPGRVFLVDWKELTTQQQGQVLNKICRLSGATKEVILRDILKIGLPLREKYTDSCGTSRMELFL